MFFSFCLYRWFFKLSEWAHFSSYDVGIRSGSSASHILVHDIFHQLPFSFYLTIEVHLYDILDISVCFESFQEVHTYLKFLLCIDNDWVCPITSNRIRRKASMLTNTYHPSTLFSCYHISMFVMHNTF